MTNLKWTVTSVDIDPDSGIKSEPVVLAYFANEKFAMLVKEALEKDWYSPTGSCDPNREFIVQYNNHG